MPSGRSGLKRRTAQTGSSHEERTRLPRTRRPASVFGTETVDFLRRFHVNKAFIGASGLAADGFCDVNHGAAWVKRIMLERAEETWLLADHGKFGRRLLEIVALWMR